MYRIYCVDEFPDSFPYIESELNRVEVNNKKLLVKQECNFSQRLKAIVLGRICNVREYSSQISIWIINWYFLFFACNNFKL